MRSLLILMCCALMIGCGAALNRQDEQLVDFNHVYWGRDESGKLQLCAQAYGQDDTLICIAVPQQGEM